MKRVLLSTILSIFYSTLLFAQWTGQSSGVTNDLYDIHFEDLNTGWAVGANGKILKTTNGGTNWTALTSGTTNQLNSVFFVSTTYGAVVGNGGLISVTLNGGGTWFPQATGYTSDFFDIFFTNSMTAYIVGDAGRILKSTDGGLTWSLKPSGTTDPLWSVWFTDANTGWAVGGSTAFGSSKILKTVDGGLNWVSQIEPTGKMFSEVTFGDNLNGWAVSESGTLIKTANGGTNWATQNSGTAVEWLYAAYSVNTQSAWVGGGGGYIASTTNGGTNWIQQASGITDAIRGLYFVDGNTGWAVGDGGKIIKYTGKSISVTSPNGGENWKVGTAQSIIWTSSNVTNVKLEYSINNGTNWTQIIASTAANAGSYGWTIPNSTTTQAFVRITDTSDNTVTDQSNAVFTIYTPTVTVTSPNGGENWKVGTNQNITWTSSNVTNAKLEYSINNGTNWTQIIASTAASAGSYSWTVPNSTTTQALVRISDTSDNTVTDQSNAVFTIYTPTVTVTSPNGGENWKVGTNQNITWTSSNVTNAKLEYSINNGTNWTQIVASIAANAGSYSWTIPNSITTQALVKISDVTDNTVTDQSNVVFTIYQPIVTVTSPNGAENWRVGTAQNITWISSNVTNVKLEYSIDNGTSWTQIVASTAANTGSYAWTVPNSSTTQALVRISDAADNTVNDQSNAVFRMYNQFVSLVFPNGGEIWRVGTSQTITWIGTNVTNAKIEYTTDNGTNWTQLVASAATNVNGLPNYYSWTIPNTPSTNCKVRITDTSDPTISDISNNTFTILQQYVTLTSPNGLENWKVGTVQNITWTSTNVTNVKLEYSINSGTSWTQIIASTPANTGSYSWTVPNSITTQALVRITDTSDNTVTDQSNNVFTIYTPVITLTSPNGGELWRVGTHHNITWTSSNVTNVKLEYSINNGSSWTQIIGSTPANTGSYSWTVPNSAITNCKARISDVSNADIKDESNASFSIVRPIIYLAYPNGGERLIPDSRIEIRWSSDYVNKFNIELTTDNGTTWTLLASNIVSSSQRFSLTVSNLPSTSCKIRISDAEDPTISDMSDNIFAIYLPALTLTSPNGGELLQVGKEYEIKWSSLNISSVKLYVSTNGGGLWTYIGTSNPGSNSFLWRVIDHPSVAPSENCKIKITDVQNINIFDISDANFTICKYNLNSPIGGEQWQGGSSHQITWSYLSVFGKTKIELSVDNGATWFVVKDSTTTSDGTSTITIPPYASEQCRARISLVNKPEINYSSPAVFTIYNLQLLSPSNGETIRSGTTYEIKWNSFNMTSVRLEYSTDNGSNWVRITDNTTASANSYPWLVPNVSSNACKIRISNSANRNQFTMTDGTFTIFIPTISVISPNGGEVFLGGSFRDIKWNASNARKVKLEYTFDNGRNWLVIEDSVLATPSLYSWSVPALNSGNCKIRVTDVLNNISDLSDNKFSITLTGVTIQSPNGGERWQSNTVHDITWISSNVTAVKIEFSNDNGVSWSLIPNGGNIPAEQGTFSWTLPNISSLQCKVKVSSTVNANLSDQSDYTFSISSLVLTSPSSNDKWQGLSRHNITWTSSNITNVKLEYSTNNGSTWLLIIASTPASAGSFSWTLPDLHRTSCKLKITDASNPNIASENNGVFAIYRYKLVMVSPNGNENWQAGKPKNITWNSYDVNQVKLYYSTDVGTTWSPIALGINAVDGNYPWTIPSTLRSQNCLIKIMDNSNAAFRDSSDQKFTICNLVLTSPNGGEIWEADSLREIKWTSENVGLVGVGYTSAYGSDLIWIQKDIDSKAGKYLWRLPHITSSNFWVYIVAMDDYEIYDENDYPFTVTTEQKIDITSPTGGTIWYVNSPQVITWRSLNLEFVKISYSFDNGFSWNIISSRTNALAGTIGWTPVTPSLQYKIKIEGLNSREKTESTAAFSVLGAPEITLSYPNGGENFESGNSALIQWSSSNVMNVKLQYRIKASGTWEDIANSVLAEERQFNWTMPRINSNECMIRAVCVENPATKDLSNNTFSIITKAVDLISPNGGEMILAGSNYDIKWKKNANTQDIAIDYSNNDGGRWIRIASNVNPNDEILNWNVPNISSGNCLVRIITISGNRQVSVLDKSERKFLIYNQTEDQKWLVAEANNKKEKCYLTDDLGFGLENVETGNSGVDEYADVVRTTTNGGKNWNRGNFLSDYIYDYAHLTKAKDNSAVIAIGPKGRWQIEDGISYYRNYYYTTRESFDASAAFFLNVNLGYIIGKNGNSEGKLLKTVDRGTSWTESSVSDEKLDAIYFLNSYNGWISANKKLYSTTDGGNSWSMKDNTQLPGGINAIYFINAQKGFVTSNNVVLRTTDGGNNWLRVGFAPSSLTEIKFKNEVEGYAIGSSGTMLHTIDGGNNWFLRNLFTTNDLVSFGWSSYDNPYVNDVTGKLYRIQQRKVNIITPIENAQLADGNQFKITWDCTPNIDKILIQFKQNGIPIDVNPSSTIDNNEFKFDAQDKSAILDLNFPTGKIDIYLMDALNKSRVYSVHSILVGNPSVNLWRVIDLAGTNDIQKMNNKFYRTSNDKLYSSTDNGLRWNLIYTTPSIEDYSVGLNKLYFVNDNIGYMVSSEFKSWMGQPGPGRSWITQAGSRDLEKLLKTTDGGQTWTSKADVTFSTTGGGYYPHGDIEIIPFIYFLNENEGWINKWQQVGVDRWEDPIYGAKWCRTNDGGSTFTNMNYDWNPSIMQFVDQTTGFCLADNNKIYKSTDSGNNWNLIKEGDAYDGLHFLNSNYGFIIGGNGLIYKTTNGGNSWASQYSGSQKSFSSIYLVNESLVYAAGGGIALKTTNGGANWRILFDGYNANFSKIFCNGSDNVFLVSNNVILFSNTGGEPSRVAKDIGDETPKEIPKNFSLAQNYPNPFNPTTTIQYELPTNSRVRINIYNILGQLVAELTNEIKSAGYYKQVWNGSSLASGVYLLRIEAESLENSERIVKSIKMLLVK